MKIGEKTLSKDSPSFIIAEIGNNHNGSIELAKTLIDEAILAGADAVKFQMRDMQSLYGSNYQDRRAEADLGTQYTLDLLDRFNFNFEQMQQVFEYAGKKEIIAFCTPWDFKSVERLELLGNPVYKVASADLTNLPLLKKLASTHKPIICSTGMSTEEEIAESSELLRSLGADFALLHCNSTYPAPFKDINLRYMSKLLNYCGLVGYSGHERGFHVPIAAVALGAKIIEKHFTLDRSMEGVDHRVSLLPNEFRDMVSNIRDVESAMHENSPRRVLNQGEMMNRENLGKSIVAKRKIEAGETIQENMLDIRSPGQGLQPNKLEKLIGAVAKRTMNPGEFFFATDLPNFSRVDFRPYKFSRHWGVPVRYHDFAKFMKISQPDFVEFHLSYSDLNENLGDFFHKKYPNLGFTTHAPELFENDHIVDLCSKDSNYLAQSIKNMKRVVDLTVKLKEYFPSQRRPFIIATVGGFTTDGPMSLPERKLRYQELIKNLRAIEHPEVEILPQSTAPFPWHMGGQQYQNLFLYPEEIKWFCEEYGYRICLDVSHSFLACNHLNLDPENFFKTVAPYTAHLHLGDCKGVDGEGLQIGEGVIDFKMLGRIFREYCPEATFIPEIWQGHKNDGEAFWIACERLEGLI